MDVHCSTCEEPWDIYHVRHEAIFETGLRTEETQAWQRLSRTEKLTATYRQLFRQVGWEFGGSIVNIIRCPACPKDAVKNPDRIATKQELENLFGDDEDGLAATYEDYGL